MALSYKNDHDQDERLNPYNRDNTAAALHEQEQQSAFDRDFDKIANHPDNQDLNQAGKNIDDQEGKPSSQWANNVKGPIGSQLTRWGKLNQLTKKKGPLGGVIFALLVVGTLLSGSFLGNFGLLFGIPNQLSDTLDSSSRAMTKRFYKAFGYATSDNPDPICQTAPKRVKCKGLGRISNTALSRLHGKGIVAVIDGQEFTPKRSGYPKSNPTHYKIDGKTVPSAELINFLTQQENAAQASKVLGRWGAFNLRYRAFMGKHIYNKLFVPLGISKNGGIADGKNNFTSINEKVAALNEKIKSRIPGVNRLGDTKGLINEKVRDRLSAARRGGPVYLTTVAGCVTLKVPDYIVAGVAGYQALAVAPLVVDLLLSPGSKMQAHGGGFGPGLTPGDADAIGTIFTETTKNSEGKMTSALDSKFLLAAIGANTGKTGVNPFAPGYAVSQNSAVKALGSVEDKTEKGCKYVMSKPAMWTAMTADSVATIALSATVIGGVIKVVGSWAISAIVTKIAANVVSSIGAEVIREIAEKDYEKLANARGEELGDAIAVSAKVLFGGAALARGVPVLSVAQLATAAQSTAEVRKLERDLDIASRSPFDIHSPHTAFGSIVHKLSLMSLQSNSSLTNVPSLLASIIKAPLDIRPQVNAMDEAMKNRCSYAEQFGYDTGNPATTPAIDSSGLPCTELLTNISTATAIAILEEEGWVDPEVTLEADSATIDDLMPSNDTYNGIGYIKEDTPLYDYIDSCMSTVATGDYILDTPGCIIRSASGTNGLGDGSGLCGEYEEGETPETRCVDDIEDDFGETLSDLDIKNPRAFEAISAFVMDVQTNNAFNGDFDEEVFEGGRGTSPTIPTTVGNLADASIECPAGTTTIGTVRTEYVGDLVSPLDRKPLIRLCELSEIAGLGVDNDGNPTSSGAVVNAAVAGIYTQLAKDIKAKAREDNKDVVLFSNSSFRLKQPSSCSPADYQSGKCAPPGTSVHQIGAAIDFRLQDGSAAGSPTSCEGRQTSNDQLWKYLNEIAPKYNIKQYSKENWHWEFVPSGVNSRNKCPLSPGQRGAL